MGASPAWLVSTRSGEIHHRLVPTHEVDGRYRRDVLLRPSIDRTPYSRKSIGVGFRKMRVLLSPNMVRAEDIFAPRDRRPNFVRPGLSPGKSASQPTDHSAHHRHGHLDAAIGQREKKTPQTWMTFVPAPATDTVRTDRAA